MSMDNINFKGLQNVAITTVNGSSRSGMLKMKAYRLSANLTNDDLGSHFKDFYQALDKTGPRTAWKYFPRFNPEDTMIFDLAKIAVDDYTIKPHVTFMLNGEHLPLDNDNILPMFSFLGKALKFIENNATQSETKIAAKDMNSIMHKEVMNYIG